MFKSQFAKETNTIKSVQLSFSSESELIEIIILFMLASRRVRLFMERESEEGSDRHAYFCMIF